MRYPLESLGTLLHDRNRYTTQHPLACLIFSLTSISGPLELVLVLAGRRKSTSVREWSVVGFHQSRPATGECAPEPGMDRRCKRVLHCIRSSWWRSARLKTSEVRKPPSHRASLRNPYPEVDAQGYHIFSGEQKKKGTQYGVRSAG